MGGSLAAVISGCAVPTTPEPGPSVASPSATPLAGQSALLQLVADLDVARAQSWPPGQAALIDWAAGVVRDQCIAVSLPAPSGVPSAGAAATSAEPDALAALKAALAQARDSFRDQALDTASAHPLTWASMAAWAGATLDQVADPTAEREPARTIQSPAPQNETEAVQSSLDAADAAIYGLGVIAGTPALKATEVEDLTERGNAWRSFRNTLTLAYADSTPPPTGTPTPAAPWYSVDRPTSRATAYAAVAALEGATLPVLGRSIAWGDPALLPTLVPTLISTAQDVPRWGGLLERWPGLPI